MLDPDALLRKRSEQLWADTRAAASLPAAQFQRWTELASTHRFLLHKAKSIIVWDWFMGGPVVQDVLNLKELSATLSEGLQVTLQGQSGSYAIGHKPVEVSPSVFIWLPKHTSLNLDIVKGGHSLSVSMIYKTKTNPAELNDGTRYALESAVFESRFPAVRF